MRVEYISNNSGGRWWLKDEDWYALEKAGWKVKWIKDNDFYKKLSSVEAGRWLGALATEASRKGLSLRDAVSEWERVTGKSATAAGCPCCGNPHNFMLYNDEGEYVESGPHTSYEADW